MHFESACILLRSCMLHHAGVNVCSGCPRCKWQIRLMQAGAGLSFSLYLPSSIQSTQMPGWPMS